MADQLQFRRGTTSEMLGFTGAQGEVVVDTDKKALVVQDGITAGGFPTATSDQVVNGTFYFNEDAGSAANAYILVPKANTNVPTSYFDGVQFGFVSIHPNTGASTANFQGLGVKNIKYRGGIDPAAGDIFGRVTLIFDTANDWLELQRKATAPLPQIRQIGGSVGSNQLTVTLDPAVIDFRSVTLNSGTVNSRTTVATQSLIVPAGATLGTINGVLSQIVALAIDNAGTVELAVVNRSGGINFDETNLISTTAISAASSSSNVVYSAVARSNVPFRVLGYVQSTQATAGTWSSAPSQVQGQGGQSLIQSMLGSAQNTTSGTAIDFTGLPPGIKRLTVLLNRVSSNGTSNFLIQLGSGAIQTTGYVGSAGGSTVAASTAGHITYGGAAAATTQQGAITFHLSSAFSWVGSGSVALDNASTTSASGSSVTLAGIIDRIRLTTVGGTDVFDAGSVNVIYEF